MRTGSRWAAATALAALATTAGIVASGPSAATGHSWQSKGDTAFNHRGTFHVPANLIAGEPIGTVTSAEIVAATKDGRKLVYTDSPTGRLGFVDIGDSSAPRPGGVVDVGGEPTSVATIGRWALVAVNTRKDPDAAGPLNAFDAPSGDLVVVDTYTKAIVKRVALAGQPDSIAISPDERYAAIVIENERDEEENDGLIPQLPAGLLQVLDLKTLSKPAPLLRSVSLTGLAEIAPTDPEPEYVDINDKNQAVVSLQENNHLAIVDLAKAKVIRHFSAGKAVVAGVDATEDDLGPQGTGIISPTETITRRREPDAVAWIDRDTFATANEGDYADATGEEGGSRSFTLFNASGRIEYESGASFEHEIIRAGHYPEGRSANKGNEPEGLKVATFNGRKLLFVGSERADVVGVYELGKHGPRFLQLLPTGIGPEGIAAIPQRGLLAVSAETDGAADDLGVRSLVTLYSLGKGDAEYPFVESANDKNGLPIPWAALSGLAGDPRSPHTIWAVSDSVLAQAYLYKVDVGRHPARITQRIAVGGVGVSDQAKGDYDVEGVAARPEGGFWLASEGRTNAGSSRPNQLLRVDAAGNVLESVALPPALVAKATSSGFEGVTVTGSAAKGDEKVWAVIQREWADDAKGFVKIARYDVAAKAWTFARYPLDAVASPSGGWVGLSEITLLPDGKNVAIVERDDRIALDARIKRVYGVDLTDPKVTWKPYGQALDTVGKRLLRDVIGDLADRSISVPDKLEGLGITADRRVFLATDNDGVEDNYGETLFFDIGKVSRAFAD